MTYQDFEDGKNPSEFSDGQQSPQRAFHFFRSGDIIQETLTLPGALPPPLGQPTMAITTYTLQPTLDHRCAPRSPMTDWWCKRGALFHEKMFSARAFFSHKPFSGAEKSKP
jgi:hypothetical protein